MTPRDELRPVVAAIVAAVDTWRERLPGVVLRVELTEDHRTAVWARDILLERSLQPSLNLLELASPETRRIGRDLLLGIRCAWSALRAELKNQYAAEAWTIGCLSEVAELQRGGQMARELWEKVEPLAVTCLMPNPLLPAPGEYRPGGDPLNCTLWREARACSLRLFAEGAAPAGSAWNSLGNLAQMLGLPRPEWAPGAEAAAPEPTRPREQAGSLVEDEADPQQPPLRAAHVAALRGMAALGRVLGSLPMIRDAVPREERRGERAVREAVRDLVEWGLAERPNGPNGGAWLTGEGRRLEQRLRAPQESR